jgi:very-short-patch-repair endonuclease
MPVAEFTCENCGKEWEKPTYRLNGNKNYFCNKQCQGEYNRGRSSPRGTSRDILVNCAYCGKEKHVKSYNYRENQSYYCDLHCLGKFKTENSSRMEIVCDTCGITFLRWPHEIKRAKSDIRYCSEKCMGEARKKRFKFDCDWCGEPAEIVECHADRTDKHFCSKLCVRSWVASGQERTKPEKIVAEILKVNCIDFEEQHPSCGRYLSDFLVGENKIIEVYGDYYHANPEVFGDFGKLIPLSEYQRGKIEDDKKRIERIKNNGYKVLILWEKDIVSNTNFVEQTILRYVNT